MPDDAPLPAPAFAAPPPAAAPGRLPPYRVAIIGGGPKGLYGFERLAAHLKARPPRRPVEIAIFNRTPHFGSGDIYRTDQPDYLLINFSIGNIDMWIDEAPPPVVPHPLPLTSWLRERHRPPLPAHHRDYAPRARVGAYLEAGFREIVDHLPPQVSSLCVVGEVVDVRPAAAGYRLTTRLPEGRRVAQPGVFHSILLATGHPRPAPTSQHLADFAAAHAGCGFVPFVYPVASALEAVPAGVAVGLKGIGLTFVDAALALTEGRGGTFVRESGRLVYHASGSEPACLVPFSRSGLPMRPRGPAWGASQTPLHFFTPEAVARLRRRGPVDFEADLWPLLRNAYYAAFYTVLFGQHGESLQIPHETAPDAQRRILDEQISRFHHRHPHAPRFTPGAFLHPLQGARGRVPAEHHTFVTAYLHDAIASARRGEACSPWMAATAVWREATAVFGAAYRFGGLTPASHRLFEERYSSRLSRVTFGPPVESMEKIVALMQAGLIDFGLSRDADVVPDAARRAFRIYSRFTSASRVVPYLIDARIPKVSLTDAAPGLYTSLLQRGLIRPFENRSAEGAAYRPGCLDLSPEGYAIDAAGRAQPTLAATGTPTEGVTFDNDSLSRSRNNFVSGWAAHLARTISHHPIYPEATHA